MWGAMIGDLAGSIYEFEQTKNIKPININNLIEENSFFSDDTILTIAIIDSVLNDRNYEKYLKEYGKKYQQYKPNFTPYFKTSFSPGFNKWINSEIEGTSIGNGAMMRISPIGYMFNTESDVKIQSKLATIPSHNNEESIKYAETVALIIFYARNGMSKEQIINKLNIKLTFKPFDKFNYTCKDTIDNCLYALFNSNSFEESIKKVISYGGDTDTNACIVGSMSEALYGIPENLINKAKQKISKEFIEILDNAYKKINKEHK